MPCAYRPSPNELDRILREEAEKRKRMRLLQVREQSRINAARFRNAYKSEYNRQINNLANECQTVFQDDKENEMRALVEEYERSLRHIGDGHHLAKDWEDPRVERIIAEETASIRAEERFRMALDELRETQAEAEFEASRTQRTRDAALEIERARAKYVASLPPPAPAPYMEAVEGNKSRPLMVCDRGAMSATHLRLVPNNYAVEPAPRGSEAGVGLDARTKAADEERRLAALRQQAVTGLEENVVKAQMRGQEAIRRELVRQDYDSMMRDLEGLSRGDRARRQRDFQRLPQRLFAVPHRVGHETRLDERSRERGFESAFANILHRNQSASESCGDDDDDDAGLPRPAIQPAAPTNVRPKTRRGPQDRPRPQGDNDNRPSRTDVGAQRGPDGRFLQASPARPTKTPLNSPVTGPDMSAPRQLAAAVRHAKGPPAPDKGEGASAERATVYEVQRRATAPRARLAEQTLQRLYDRIRRQRDEWWGYDEPVRDCDNSNVADPRPEQPQPQSQPLPQRLPEPQQPTFVELMSNASPSAELANGSSTLSAPGRLSPTESVDEGRRRPGHRPPMTDLDEVGRIRAKLVTPAVVVEDEQRSRSGCEHERLDEEMRQLDRRMEELKQRGRQMTVGARAAAVAPKSKGDALRAAETYSIASHAGSNADTFSSAQATLCSPPERDESLASARSASTLSSLADVRAYQKRALDRLHASSHSPSTGTGSPARLSASRLETVELEHEVQRLRQQLDRERQREELLRQYINVRATQGALGLSGVDGQRNVSNQYQQDRLPSAAPEVSDTQTHSTSWRMSSNGLPSASTVPLDSDIFGYAGRSLRTPTTDDLATQSDGGAVGHADSTLRTPTTGDLTNRGDGGAVGRADSTLRTPTTGDLTNQGDGGAVGRADSTLRTPTTGDLGTLSDSDVPPLSSGLAIASTTTADDVTMQEILRAALAAVFRRDTEDTEPSGPVADHVESTIVVGPGELSFGTAWTDTSQLGTDGATEMSPSPDAAAVVAADDLDPDRTPVPSTVAEEEEEEEEALEASGDTLLPTLSPLPLRYRDRPPPVQNLYLATTEHELSRITEVDTPLSASVATTATARGLSGSWAPGEGEAPVDLMSDHGEAPVDLMSDHGEAPVDLMSDHGEASVDAETDHCEAPVDPSLDNGEAPVDDDDVPQPPGPTIDERRAALIRGFFFMNADRLSELRRAPGPADEVSSLHSSLTQYPAGPSDLSSSCAGEDAPGEGLDTDADVERPAPLRQSTPSPPTDDHVHAADSPPGQSGGTPGVQDTLYGVSQCPEAEGAPWPSDLTQYAASDTVGTSLPSLDQCASARDGGDVGGVPWAENQSNAASALSLGARCPAGSSLTQATDSLTGVTLALSSGSGGDGDGEKTSGLSQHTATQSDRASPRPSRSLTQLPATDVSSRTDGLSQHTASTLNSAPMRSLSQNPASCLSSGLSSAAPGSSLAQVEVSSSSGAVGSRQVTESENGSGAGLEQQPVSSVGSSDTRVGAERSNSLTQFPASFGAMTSGATGDAADGPASLTQYPTSTVASSGRALSQERELSSDEETNIQLDGSAGDQDTLQAVSGSIVSMESAKAADTSDMVELPRLSGTSSLSSLSSVDRLIAEARSIRAVNEHSLRSFELMSSTGILGEPDLSLVSGSLRSGGELSQFEVKLTDDGDGGEPQQGWDRASLTSFRRHELSCDSDDARSQAEEEKESDSGAVSLQAAFEVHRARVHDRRMVELKAVPTNGTHEAATTAGSAGRGGAGSGLSKRGGPVGPDPAHSRRTTAPVGRRLSPEEPLPSGTLEEMKSTLEAWKKSRLTRHVAPAPANSHRPPSSSSSSSTASSGPSRSNGDGDEAVARTRRLWNQLEEVRTREKRAALEKERSEYRLKGREFSDRLRAHRRGKATAAAAAAAAAAGPASTRSKSSKG